MNRFMSCVAIASMLTLTSCKKTIAPNAPELTSQKVAGSHNVDLSKTPGNHFFVTLKNGSRYCITPNISKLKDKIDTFRNLSPIDAHSKFEMLARECIAKENIYNENPDLNNVVFTRYTLGDDPGKVLFLCKIGDYAIVTE